MADSCLICGKKAGWLSKKIEISQGPVCGECLKKCGVGNLTDPFAFNQASFMRFFEERVPMVKKFSPTKTVGDYLSIDETNRLFKVGPDIFTFGNLLKFDLYDESSTTSTTKGGLGDAVLGGALFGEVGAIVGATTGRQTTTSTSTEYTIRITLQNAHIQFIELQFTEPDRVRTCISALEIITRANQPLSSAGSIADELIKYKALLDSGAISQDEFSLLKSKLLK